MENKKLLTILLPLRGREVYTSVWVRENMFEDFNYIIADGSEGNANQIIIESLGVRENIRYIRFPFDASVKDYVDKFLKASSEVKTPYVMTCDNDDFINPEGINRCLQAIEKKSEIVMSGGIMFGISDLKIQRKDGHIYSLPLPGIELSALDQLKGFDAIKVTCSDYKYTWYSIFRTKNYVEIWSEIQLLGISNIFLIELAHVLLSLCKGAYSHVDACHYIRLSNPYTSVSREAIKAEGFPHNKICFDELYRKEVYILIERVANNLGVEPKEIQKEMINFFIRRRNKKNFSKQFLLMCQNLFSRVQIILRYGCSVSGCRDLTNLLLK